MSRLEPTDTRADHAVTRVKTTPGAGLDKTRSHPRLPALLLLIWAVLAWGLAGADSADRCVIHATQIELEGGVVPLRQAGRGPAILLLHGLFANKEQWDALLCPLAAGGYTALAPDLPGYGASTGFPIADYALENQVARLDALIERLGLEQVDVAGNSMGGTIAALYARAHPERVRSLALIGAPLGVTGWGPEVRAALYLGINPFIPVTTEELDLELSLLFMTPPILPDEVKAALVADYVERNRRYQQVWTIVGLFDEVLARPGFRVRTPTLVIWGAQDRIFPVTGAGALRFAFPRGKRLVLPDAGHLPHLENTETIAAEYLAFLQTHAKGPWWRLDTRPEPAAIALPD